MFGAGPIYASGGGDPEFVDIATCNGTFSSPGSFSGLTGYQEDDWLVVIAATSTGDGPVSFVQSGWTTVDSTSVGGIYRRQLGSSDNPNNYDIRPSALPGWVVAIGYVIRNVTTFQGSTDAGTSASVTESSITTPAIAMGAGGRANSTPPSVTAAFDDVTIADAGTPNVSLRGGYDELATGSSSTISVTGSGAVTAALVVAW